MELSEARGKLVAIGGAEERDGEAVILKEFVRLAKGSRARILVLTAATDLPREVGSDYREAFKRLGVDDVRVLDISERRQAQDEEALKLVAEATGLFFTGGDQLHVTSLLGGTPLQAEINRRYERGMVLAGTSAGAAMMSNSMLIGGHSDESPQFEGAQIGPGMDFIIGAIIDTHFSQRGRHGRLLTAVAHYPQDLGIGLDENTAIVVDGREFTVIGAGAVTVMDAGAATYTNLPYLEEQESRVISLFNVRLHVLSAGHGFDLAAREPIQSERVPPRERPSNSGKSARSKKSSKG